MNKKIIPIMIAVIIIAGAGGFYGGMKYSQSKNQNSGRNMAGFFADSESGNGQQRMRIFAGENAGNIAGQRADGEFASGEILAKDEQSLTIKLRDGGSKIVFYSGSTEVMKTATGTPAELKIGDTITAIGSANQDGSITAQSIQMRPEMPISSPVN
ncbi:hypothetical protein A3H55_03070 [Candidatus Kuenenbacteria bacterium RIFCSPLOWO2_02_FULL_42_16]|uniref:DUF5666 domain-containing protein n=1 Tax=Candidatus Kuenenbacteria bacterium RIFCSPLOWO2_02_FULL_42_16 TaxID=1798564 RepID=A0A1F6FXF7_9BACT|nr:MAG: hypothetical protein A3H55_03070 [Candidatus Kuenenbacteria bacterium RIFCSPLOWO2_02_FULL_42_16]